MLRCRVELLPHGIDAGLEPIYEILVENNGEGIPGGPNEGGVGCYNVFPPEETMGHLHMVDYPSMYACGRIEGVERNEHHRLVVAGHALSIAAEALETRPEDRHAPNAPQIVRVVGK